MKWDLAKCLILKLRISKRKFLKRELQLSLGTVFVNNIGKCTAENNHSITITLEMLTVQVVVVVS